MDWNDILNGVEGKEELIKKLEAEIGKAYVPRTEFNAKNTELKSLQGQFNDLRSNLDVLSGEKDKWQSERQTLEGKLKTLEHGALCAQIAREVGLPHELISRLQGENEEGLRADAQSLMDVVKRQQEPIPVKSLEPQLEGQDSAYRALLKGLQG